MIEIHQIRLRCGTDPQLQMDSCIRRILRLKTADVFSWKITRHAVDARKKPELYDVYSVQVDFPKEKKISGHVFGRDVGMCQREPYLFPGPSADARRLNHRPVVVGLGPAGIFCSLMLARAGFRPIVLERGERMEDRIASVTSFWNGGVLNPESNIQFGEGGAGTFSDGKLNSNVKDSSGRVRKVLETFAAAGAPEDILYEQIPHIGTDRLRQVIRCLRNDILMLGGEIWFETKMTGLILKDGRVCGVRYESSESGQGGSEIGSVGGQRKAAGTGPYSGMNFPSPGSTGVIPCDILVLAPGHSARDTIRVLRAQDVPMESKPFAVGLRVSHPQNLINASQYGISDPGEMRRLHLAPAGYKLAAKAADARGVYSFCMCPGGYVVNASSEPGRLAVNGMSDYLRNSPRANSAIVMSVSPKDYGEGLLDGLRFQEGLEERAFQLAGGLVPVQRFASFEQSVCDTQIPSGEALCIKGMSAPGALHELLPRNLTEDFIFGMHEFGRKIRYFDGPDAYVIGLESRTSSPVRILRGESGESSVTGLYPCGEGAGYAGGITSAAVDGIRTAEHIAQRCLPA